MPAMLLFQELPLLIDSILGVCGVPGEILHLAHKVKVQAIYNSPLLGKLLKFGYMRFIPAQAP